jgi:hypothetical protein
VSFTSRGQISLRSNATGRQKAPNTKPHTPHRPHGRGHWPAPLMASARREEEGATSTTWSRRSSVQRSPLGSPAAATLPPEAAESTVEQEGAANQDLGHGGRSTRTNLQVVVPRGRVPRSYGQISTTPSLAVRPSTPGISGGERRGGGGGEEEENWW